VYFKEGGRIECYPIIGRERACCFAVSTCALTGKRRVETVLVLQRTGKRKGRVATTTEKEKFLRLLLLLGKMHVVVKMKNDQTGRPCSPSQKKGKDARQGRGQEKAHMLTRKSSDELVL